MQCRNDNIFIIIANPEWNFHYFFEENYDKMKISECNAQKKNKRMPLEGLCFREKGSRSEGAPGRTDHWRNHEKDDGADHPGRSGRKMPLPGGTLCAVGADAADGGRSGRKDLLSGTGSEKFSY